MAAYAEGLNILRNANAGKAQREVDAETAPLENPEYYQYDLDIPEVAEVWRRGSVIGSWLLDLTAEALQESPDLSDFAGRVSDSGEGRWTSIAAIEEGVPAPVLEHGAVLALRLARPRRLRRQGAVGDAQAVRRPRREGRCSSQSHGPGDGHRHPAASHRPGGRADGRGDRRRPGARAARCTSRSRAARTPRADLRAVGHPGRRLGGGRAVARRRAPRAAGRPGVELPPAGRDACSSAPGRSPTRFRPRARRRRPRAPTRARSAGASPRGRTASRRSISRSWVSGRTGTPPRSSPTPRRSTPGARYASRCTTRPSRRPTASA